MYGVGEGLTRCPACLADLGSGIGSDDVQIPEQDAEPLVDLESDSISASPTVPYASTRSHAATLRLMFTVWAALAGASAAVSFAGFLMTRRALSEPFAYDQDQLRVWDVRSLRLGVVLIAASLITGILFASWLLRSYRNVLALGRPTSYQPRWAVLGWLIPIVSLVVPKQVVDETWEQSNGPLSARWWIHTWWGLFLLTQVVSSLLLLFRDPNSLQQLSTDLLFDGVLSVTDIAGATLAFWLVTRLTEIQEQEAGIQRLTETAVVFRPRRWRLAPLVALPLLGVITLAIVLPIIHEAPSRPSAVPEHPGIYQGHGIEFDYPADMPAVEIGIDGRPGEIRFDEGSVLLVQDAGDEILIISWFHAAEAPAEEQLSTILANVADSIFEGYGPGRITRGPDVWLDDLMSTEDVGPFLMNVSGIGYQVDRLWVAGAAGHCNATDRLVMVVDVHPGVSTARSRVEQVVASLTC
ncbi:DUF4328 domain-containing protein [bacterium]|nr:DUF4328 domain-containing protein [bacterium]